MCAVADISMNFYLLMNNYKVNERKKNRRATTQTHKVVLNVLCNFVQH